MLHFVVHAQTTWSSAESGRPVRSAPPSLHFCCFFLCQKKAIFSPPLFSYFLHHQVLSFNSALLFLPVVALCILLAGNRRSLGCESPIDFGKRRVSWISPLRSHSCAFVAPSTNTLWFLSLSLSFSLTWSHHDSLFHFTWRLVRFRRHVESAVDCFVSSVMCPWGDPPQQMSFQSLAQTKRWQLHSLVLDANDHLTLIPLHFYPRVLWVVIYSDLL